MDKTEGIIRWSPNSARAQFVAFNLNYRILQVYEAKGLARPGNFEYEPLSRYIDIPSLNTFDWSPVVEGLVAVGTSSGELQLLRVDDNSNAVLSLSIKQPRACQAVAFNTTGLLAIGLERVRNDGSLQIWDINQRLADWDTSQPGWKVPNNAVEPRKLESATVTSIKFFEDQPQTLAIGIKNSSVRIHDLRDPSGGVITFQTKCNNNLTIDYSDPNYFASSSLDQPGVMVWDRRVSTRATASPMYLDAFDNDGYAWGAALQLKKVISTDKQGSYIKSLRYCREQRGTLGVLSNTGQLQILKTNKEYYDPGSEDDVKGSPELLQVSRSSDLEYPYFDTDRGRKQEDRIVSFDWLTLGTTDLQPRVVALRASGSLEIMQTPPTSTDQMMEFMPWQQPHNHDKVPYHTLMDFADATERRANLGPLYANELKFNTPIFGPDGYNTPHVQESLAAALDKALERPEAPASDVKKETPGSQISRASFTKSTFAEAIDRQFEIADDPVLETFPKGGGVGAESVHGSLSEKLSAINLLSKFKSQDPSTTKICSSRDMHEILLRSRIPASKADAMLIDNLFIERALNGYLFDCNKNKSLVKEDPWLRDVWYWISLAEKAAKDDGMLSSTLDLSYLGAYTLWNNKLGGKAESRLVESTVVPDPTQWERLIAVINKRIGYEEYTGVPTMRPQHRQLCLAQCGFAKPVAELREILARLQGRGEYTKAAARALFEGEPELAVDILRRGDKELVFAAVALDVTTKSPPNVDLSNWSKTLEDQAHMSGDPYLRAIFGYVTTRDWEVIANETALPLRYRAGVALRYLSDLQLTEWLDKEMEEAIVHGDIEGIVLAGITDNMVDILAKYVAKFFDYQTAILIMSFCYPRYISDIRCDAWRQNYQAYLNRHQQFILRVQFDQGSAKKSRQRDGIPVIKPPIRQVTVRCLYCDNRSSNDRHNASGAAPAPPNSSAGPSSSADERNPLISSGINAGLSCPRCGSHLPRCGICLEICGSPRSDRPELSNDPMIKRMGNQLTFCMKCKHAAHMDHAIKWFDRHLECPIAECKCQCNFRPNADIA
ncbi:7621c237-80b6-46d4-b0cd-f253746b7def [Sclerotinia trifoliorum]|uniref:7621c237-80b6-46d4-b0cd-f253746b7def n=1 Tax=Sclerotinia trifoliorum TaxID=28548 RepID=A0A8H2VR44_9HELO|nr:7621c237-80b6-46d4-b0cd-f253746b7def [Sclerotinia trifoliorum]